MTSMTSTAPAPGGLEFPAALAANSAHYRRLIRRQRLMGWARQFGLEDDLEQLALLELARLTPRYDPARSPSLDHYFGAILSDRMSDCVRQLKRQHRDIVDGSHSSFDSADDSATEATDEDAATRELASNDSVFDYVAQAQSSRALARAIETLPARQREVTALVLEDLTDREIADKLGVSACSDLQPAARPLASANPHLAMQQHLSISAGCVDSLLFSIAPCSL
jgi:RNA polymerase sigma factor (sigma-70 family)